MFEPSPEKRKRKKKRKKRGKKRGEEKRRGGFLLKCQSHMIAAVARPRERAARAGGAEKRTYCQTSRADHGIKSLPAIRNTRCYL